MEKVTKLEKFNSPVNVIEPEKKGTEKIPVCDQSNGLEISNVKSDRFVVDVACLSHITAKELTANSKLNRSLSRKGSQQKSNERKTNPINDNEKHNKIFASASPRATLGAGMLEKPIVGSSDRAQAQAHHQITIKTTGSGGAESRSPVKRHSFRRSQPSWAFDPRTIFFFLATLSSMGTILLIYFTLSISKSKGDDSAQNW